MWYSQKIGSKQFIPREKITWRDSYQSRWTFRPKVIFLIDLQAYGICIEIMDEFYQAQFLVSWFLVHQIKGPLWTLGFFAIRWRHDFCTGGFHGKNTAKTGWHHETIPDELQRLNAWLNGWGMWWMWRSTGVSTSFMAYALRSFGERLLAWVAVGWDMLSYAVFHSGQIIATSHDLTPKGSQGREISLFQGNPAWWNIIIWPIHPATWEVFENF